MQIILYILFFTYILQKTFKKLALNVFFARQVFEKLAVLDMQYMDDEEEEIFIPSFGQSDTDLEVSTLTISVLHE